MRKSALRNILGQFTIGEHERIRRVLVVTLDQVEQDVNLDIKKLDPKTITGPDLLPKNLYEGISDF